MVTGAPGPPGLNVMQTVEENKTELGTVMILLQRMEDVPVLEIGMKLGSVTEVNNVQVRQYHSF